MMKILLRPIFRFSKFKLEDYSNQDYATMCGLLHEKFQLHNEQVQTSGLVKLVDDGGRVIGIYTASEARRKANGLKLDMVLINKTSNPMVCRAVDFRNRVLSRFYEEVVSKVQTKEQTRAISTKNIKVSPNLNKNDMIIKIRQIKELSNKHAKVRVFMNIKQSQRDQSLGKLEELKSLLMNTCYVEEEVSNRRFEQEEQSSKQQKQVQTFSFVIRAREFDVVKKPKEEKNETPDEAVKKFMAKYYNQDEVQMMDLKSAGFFQTETGIQLKEQDLGVQGMKGIQSMFEQQKSDFEINLEREAQARVLNKRLKVLLAFTI